MRTGIECSHRYMLGAKDAHGHVVCPCGARWAPIKLPVERGTLSPPPKGKTPKHYDPIRAPASSTPAIRYDQDGSDNR